MEFTAQVTLVEKDTSPDVVSEEQSNTEKAKTLLFEALRLLAEDDPNILIEAKKLDITEETE